MSGQKLEVTFAELSEAAVETAGFRYLAVFVYGEFRHTFPMSDAKDGWEWLHRVGIEVEWAPIERALSTTKVWRSSVEANAAKVTYLMQAGQNAFAAMFGPDPRLP